MLRVKHPYIVTLMNLKCTVFAKYFPIHFFGTWLFDVRADDFAFNDRIDTCVGYLKKHRLIRLFVFKKKKCLLRVFDGTSFLYIWVGISFFCILIRTLTRYLLQRCSIVREIGVKITHKENFFGFLFRCANLAIYYCCWTTKTIISGLKRGTNAKQNRNV